MWTKRARTAFLFALLALFLLASVGVRAQDAPAPLDTYDAQNPQNLKASDILGKAALVMDAETGVVLFEKNIDRVMYPASTTKIMTCLLALEQSAPDEIVTIPTEAGELSWDSSKVPVTPGEKIPMLDLLYGLMMNSGNDAAIAVAIHVAGSTTAFVQMMNERAEALGCKNTHFTNVHGLHDPKHVSTARDLALIAREAMKNRTFREIVAAKTYTLPATSLREKLRLETSYAMYVASSKYYYPDLIGVKSGFHSKAGYCFVGAANKDGSLLLSVVLKTDKTGRWTDTARLLDYGATRYKTYTFDELYAQAPLYLSVEDAARDDEEAGLVKLAVVPGGTTSRYTVRCLPERLPQTLQSFSENLCASYKKAVAPIQKGDILGTVSLTTADGVLTGTLVAERAVAKDAVPFSPGSLLPASPLATGLWIGGLLLVALVVLVLVLRARAAARRRRRQAMLRRRREEARRAAGR